MHPTLLARCNSSMRLKLYPKPKTNTTALCIRVHAWSSMQTQTTGDDGAQHVGVQAASSDHDAILRFDDVAGLPSANRCRASSPACRRHPLSSLFREYQVSSHVSRRPPLPAPPPPRCRASAFGTLCGQSMDSCLTNDSVHAVVAYEQLQRPSDENVCLSGRSQLHLPPDTHLHVTFKSLA